MWQTVSFKGSVYLFRKLVSKNCIISPVTQISVWHLQSFQTQNKTETTNESDFSSVCFQPFRILSSVALNQFNSWQFEHGQKDVCEVRENISHGKCKNTFRVPGSWFSPHRGSLLHLLFGLSSNSTSFRQGVLACSSHR